LSKHLLHKLVFFFVAFLHDLLLFGAAILLIKRYDLP
jgi:hypothetical protein